MPDIFLYAGEVNPKDVVLSDPTVQRSGGGAVTGTLASTLDGVTLDATGAEAFTGTLAATLGDVTLAATGSETFTGALATTLDGVTFAAAGTVIAAVTGTLATTLADVTLAATGAETFTGTLATALDGVTLVATGDVLASVTGTLATTLDGVTLAASGSVVSDVAPVSPPSGASSKHWYVKYDEERRKKEKRPHVRSFQDMLADAATARAEKARVAATPQRVSAPVTAEAPAPPPAVRVPTYLEVLRDAPRLPAPVYKVYSSHYSTRPIIPISFRKPIPVIPEKIRKQRIAMNTLVLALSILED